MLEVRSQVVLLTPGVSNTTNYIDDLKNTGRHHSENNLSIERQVYTKALNHSMVATHSRSLHTAIAMKDMSAARRVPPTKASFVHTRVLLPDILHSKDTLTSKALAVLYKCFYVPTQRDWRMRKASQPLVLISSDLSMISV